MDLITQLQRDFGPGKIHKASEAPELEVVSSGSVSLDFATGIGGFPRGTLVEVFGPESIGKTSFSYYALNEELKAGRHVGFVNLEGLFNAEWALKLCPDMDLERVLVASPDPGTEAVEILEKMVKSGALGRVVFDSIGAMLGDKEQEIGEKKQAGGQSALVTHMVKSILVPAFRNKCTVIFLNHVRDVFGATIPTLESPGGHAAKHGAVMRIQLKPTRDKYTDVVDGEKKEIGYRVAALIKKNKVGPPKKIATWNFYTDKVNGYPLGIDHDQEILDLAMSNNVISRSGAYYEHSVFPTDKNGNRRIQGKDAVAAYLKEYPEDREVIRLELMGLANRNGVNR